MTEGLSRIDQELCTGCGNCTATCPADAISGERNHPHEVSEERCVGCGRCVQVCSAYDTVFEERKTPRAERLRQRGLPLNLAEPLFAANNACCLPAVQSALADPDRVVIAQCGPATLDSIAEDFGCAPGSIPAGKIIAALKKIGFQKIYDFSFPAALAVLEEAQELAGRVQAGRILPVINSSCPAAVKFIEQSYPELIHYLAGSKSPHQIAGALIKSYVAGMLKLDPAKIFSLSIGPCTSRRFEAARPEMTADGLANVDAVMTVRELAYLIKDSGIELQTIKEEAFDAELPSIAEMEGVYCSAGDVAEAVVTVCRNLMTPAAQDVTVKFENTEAEGVRTASIALNAANLKIAAITGLPAAVPFLDAMKAGKSDLAFLELLACPRGCVSGGGQPKVLLPQDKDGVYAERARFNAGSGGNNRGAAARNPAVLRIYEDFFHKPCGDKSNRILQTQYVERKLSQ